MTADELHALAVRTRDAARLAERHGTSTHGYRRAAREACERMGEMAEQLADVTRERNEAHLAIDQALGGGMEDLERQLAEMTRECDEACDVVNRCANVLRRLVPEMASRGGPCLPGEIEHALSSAVHFRDEARARLSEERGMVSEARAALRDLVAALGLDDGPRAKAIQHAREVLEEWGMR